MYNQICTAIEEAEADPLLWHVSTSLTSSNLILFPVSEIAAFLSKSAKGRV